MNNILGKSTCENMAQKNPRNVQVLQADPEQWTIYLTWIIHQQSAVFSALNRFHSKSLRLHLALPAYNQLFL